MKLNIVLPEWEQKPEPFCTVYAIGFTFLKRKFAAFYFAEKGLLQLFGLGEKLREEYHGLFVNGDVGVKEWGRYKGNTIDTQQQATELLKEHLASEIMKLVDPDKPFLE